MRSADNFNPEWGYLAPRPGFLRSARIAFVAAAIGATSSGAVVYALIEPPAAEGTSVAARTLVRSADSAIAATAVTAPVQAVPVLPHIAASARGAGPAGIGTSKSASAAQGPSGVSALAEAPAVTASPPSASETNTGGTTANAASVGAASVQRKVVRKQHPAWPGIAREQALTSPYGWSRAPMAQLPSGGFWQRGED